MEDLQKDRFGARPVVCKDLENFKTELDRIENTDNVYLGRAIRGMNAFLYSEGVNNFLAHPEAPTAQVAQHQ